MFFKIGTLQLEFAIVQGWEAKDCKAEVGTTRQEGRQKGDKADTMTNKKGKGDKK